MVGLVVGGGGELTVLGVTAHRLETVRHREKCSINKLKVIKFSSTFILLYYSN